MSKKYVNKNENNRTRLQEKTVGYTTTALATAALYLATTMPAQGQIFDTTSPKHDHYGPAEQKQNDKWSPRSQNNYQDEDTMFEVPDYARQPEEHDFEQQTYEANRGPGHPACSTPNPPFWCEDPEVPPGQIPVDGGLALLALAGVGYGTYTLRRKDKDEE